MKFFIFPNGFFPSFVQHEYRETATSKGKKSKKHKKDKDSDAEDDPNVTLLETTKIENIKENETGTIVSESVEEIALDGDDNSESQSHPITHSKK